MYRMALKLINYLTKYKTYLKITQNINLYFISCNLILAPMLIIVVYNFTSDSHFYLARLHNNIIYLDAIIIIII